MATITIFPEESPKIVRVNLPDTELTLQSLVNLCRDWEESPEGVVYPKIITASGKENLGGGVSVGITVQLQNAQVMFEGRPTSIDAGAVTSADPDGELLTDSAADFVTAGVYVGCTVYNVTTTAMAVCLEISTTWIRHFPLLGGSRNTWLIGDSYLVYPNVQCSIQGGNLVAVDEAGNSISAVLQSPNVQVVRTSSASATLQEASAPQYSVLDEQLSEHTTTGSLGKVLSTMNTDLSKVLQISKGRWKIVNNQMIMYEENGVDALYTVNLYDKQGVISEVNAFERVPI